MATAIAIVEQGIRDIQSESQSWRAVLERVANELPADISSVIRNDMDHLVTRSIAQAGVEMRCNVDFLSNRAIQSLERIKAELLGQVPASLGPEFCQTPPSIDLNLSPDKWQEHILDGYDLDQRDRSGALVQFYFLHEDGSTTSVTEDRIGRTTHYQVTVNLSEPNFQRWLYASRAVKLVATWNGEVLDQGETVISPWSGETRLEYSSLQNYVYIPPRVYGDGDFDTDEDNFMAVNLAGGINVQDTFIDGHVYMRAQEREDDYTTVEGWSDWHRLYDAPPGWQIVAVRPQSDSHESQNILTHGEQSPYWRPAGEVVEKFIVFGDTDDDEADFYTRVDVYWRPLEVTIREVAPAWLR